MRRPERESPHAQLRQLQPQVRRASTSMHGELNGGSASLTAPSTASADLRDACASRTATSESSARSRRTDQPREAFDAATRLLDDAGLPEGIEAVGHRVVHGGCAFRSAGANRRRRDRGDRGRQRAGAAAQPARRSPPFERHETPSAPPCRWSRRSTPPSSPTCRTVASLYALPRS